MLNSNGTRTHPWRRPWPTSNHSDNIPPSSRTHARIPSWNWCTISTITGGTPNRARTTQRRERSTESYAFWRSTKQVYNGTPSFLPSSCNRRTTNIMSTVDLPGRIVTPAADARVQGMNQGEGPQPSRGPFPHVQPGRFPGNCRNWSGLSFCGVPE